MENNDYIRQIEINGIKVEVDLRTCKTITTYKIGDNVKVLKKAYSGFSVYSGVIVDFVAFKERPALVVAYFDQSYSSGTEIKFETITQDSTDIEIAPCLPHELKLNKARVIDKFDIAIAAKEREADDLRDKKAYFIENFAKFFEQEPTE